MYSEFVIIFVSLKTFWIHFIICELHKHNNPDYI